MHEDQLLSQKAFAALSKDVNQTVSQYSWLGQYGNEFLWFGLRLALFFAGFGLFSLSHTWWTRLASIAIIAYAFYGVGITGTHESRHNAFVRTRRANERWGYFFGDFWSGESSLWWYSHHVQDHHVYTNIHGKDEEYFSFPWINRYIYFFLAPYLMLFLLVYGSIKFLWGKWRDLCVYSVLAIAGYAFQTWLFAFTVSWPWAIFCTWLMRSFYSPVFMHLALFNHIGLERLMEKIPWLPHQTKTTRNLKPNWFLVGMGGNAFVHRHIEHHLFPSISNRMLVKIHPLVQNALKTEGYMYIEQTYSECLRLCLVNYKQLFLKGPPPIMVR